MKPTLPFRLAFEDLGWPTEGEIFQPQHPAARLLVKDADRRVARVLRREHGVDVRVGVLMEEDSGALTPGPLALICDFAKAVAPGVLRHAHRLAWNFSRSTLLLTIEPTVIRAWTCCEPPLLDDDGADDDSSSPELDHFDVQDLSIDAASDAERRSRSTIELLHWISLVSGAFARNYPGRFTRDGRADHQLLANLRFVSGRLGAMGLVPPVVHDLLARIIFLQFLFDRTDAQGRSALGSGELQELYDAGILGGRHDSLASILSSHRDTYALFGYLNDRFNGDLFARPEPGEDVASALRRERSTVRAAHLKVLADFVGGSLEMDNGQLSMWRLYSFDSVPLDFVSSVYEEFVAKEEGVVYTPAFLVDFILDEALPWHSPEWNVRVLDPSCGSGIFLVKAYQRLIHRWKIANDSDRINVATLRRILRRNIMGVDRDEEAIRVAAFSLYLALCDEIDPRHLWSEVRFPTLLGTRLLHADFFEEDVLGVRTKADVGSADVVVGNAPWAAGSLKNSRAAVAWQQMTGWRTFDKNIGPLFLAKSAALASDGGRVALLLPAAILYNQTAGAFRNRLFNSFAIETIVNLSALRRGLFPDASAPACLIVMRAEKPTGDPISYVTPKSRQPEDDVFGVSVEPYDVAWVSQWEALHDGWVWSVLLWGGRRDLALLKRISVHGRTLAALCETGGAAARNGIQWKGRELQNVPELRGRREIPKARLERRNVVFLRPESLKPVRSTRIYKKDSRSLEAFAPPQVVIRRSWSTMSRRFEAALISRRDMPDGVICSQNFVSIHVNPDKQPDLEAACLMANSRLAAYYYFLTSGRVASYRPNLSVTDLLSLPYPEPIPGLVAGLRSLDDVDERIRRLWGLDEAEWSLVDDFGKYTLSEIEVGARGSAGKRGLEAAQPATNDALKGYAKALRETLERSFDTGVMIVTYPCSARVPIRIVKCVFDENGSGGIVESNELAGNDVPTVARRLHSLLSPDRGQPGIRYSRLLKVYTRERSRIGSKNCPAVILVKPDAVRYWTHSVALRDADGIVADGATSHNQVPQLERSSD